VLEYLNVRDVHEFIICLQKYVSEVHRGVALHQHLAAAHGPAHQNYDEEYETYYSNDPHIELEAIQFLLESAGKENGSSPDVVLLSRLSEMINEFLSIEEEKKSLEGQDCAKLEHMETAEYMESCNLFRKVGKCVTVCAKLMRSSGKKGQQCGI